MEKRFTILANPESEVGLAVGSGFIAIEGCHDVATSPITKKRRFIVNIKPNDMAWLIEALAKELNPELRDEAILRIESLVETVACENCEFEPAEPGSKFCEICG